jgi:hypothetical protein
VVLSACSSTTYEGGGGVVEHAYARMSACQHTSRMLDHAAATFILLHVCPHTTNHADPTFIGRTTACADVC